ncbi:MAG: DUF4105 domain-containing protein [Planctomycetales bacterium]|nr:DUF4105 domain-containing protein [Planctomycetales bacterium]
MRAICLMLLVACLGCSSFTKVLAPSNVRNWSADQSVLPYAQFRGHQVEVHNIRHCRYFQDDTYVVNHFDKTYDLGDLQHVDFFVIPFENMPAIAHTMLSFEFVPESGVPDYLVASVEIRKEEGETYAAWKGTARQYELMYVLADERDAVQVRANDRSENVYLYRTTATPEQARQLLVDVLGRTNELASRPEFYNTVTNNCTTNIARHINRIVPNRLRYDYHILLPGYSDKLAYQEGLIEHHGTFEETKARAYVTPKAIMHAGKEDFSQLIRL